MIDIDQLTQDELDKFLANFTAKLHEVHRNAPKLIGHEMIDIDQLKWEELVALNERIAALSNRIADRLRDLDQKFSMDGANFEKEVIPKSGGHVSEATRLRSALTGAFVYFIHQVPQYAFSSAIFFGNSTEDPPKLSDEHKQFEVAEDTSGVERTIVIQSKGGISAVEIIPMDERRRSLDFTRHDISANRCSIGYRKDSSPEWLKIRFTGLNVLRVHTAWAYAWTDEMKKTFHQPFIFSIERPDVIRVDRLDNSGRGARKLEAHLQALFGILLDLFDFSANSCKLDCNYEYQIGEGFPEPIRSAVPVLLIYPMSGGQDFSALAGEIQQWYRNYQPPDGDFVFSLQIYNHLGAPLIDLQRLLLPLESIEDMA